MRFVYAPEGRDPRIFELIPDELTTVEGELAEESGGTQWRTFGHWVGLLQDGSLRAWRVGTWLLLRREDPTIELDDVVGKVGDINLNLQGLEDVEPGKDEPVDSPTDST